MREGGGDPALVVARVSSSLLVVAPIRAALGIGFLALSVALGAGRSAGLLAFAVGAFGLCLAALADPRRLFLASRVEPVPLPAGALVESRLELARHAVFPSTVGVSVLAGFALAAGSAVLAALLAGALAGMGLASLLTGADLALREREQQAELLVERRTRRLYERRAEGLVRPLTKS